LINLGIRICIGVSITTIEFIIGIFQMAACAGDEQNTQQDEKLVDKWFQDDAPVFGFC
jgi:CTP synthase (UTP-ammonia lyase)